MNVIESRRPRIERRVGSYAARPAANRHGTPVTGGLAQCATTRALTVLDSEVEERSGDIAKTQGAARSVKSRFDHRVLARGQMPGASDARRRALCEVKLGRRVV